MQVKLILGLVLALLVAVFALQNAQAVDINFLVFTIEQAPVAGVIIGMLAVGVFLGLILSVPSSWGRGRKIRELEAEVKRREESTQHLTRQLLEAREELASVYVSSVEDPETVEPSITPGKEKA